MKKIIGSLKSKVKSLKLKIPAMDIKGLTSKIKGFDLKKAKLKKQHLFGVLIAVVVIVILARTTGNIQKVLFRKAPAKAPTLTFEDEASPVKAFKVRKMDFKDTLPAIGNIKGFKEVDLKFQTSGIMESFNFE